MQQAGGIIALVAGIFGTLAAVITLFVGGMGAAFEADKADTVVWLGWGGVFFSFLTIVLGAVAMNTASRAPGLLIVVSSLAGAVLGGTLVAVCMALALTGGLLAAIGRPRPFAHAQESADRLARPQESADRAWSSEPSGLHGVEKWAINLILLPVVLSVIVFVTDNFLGMDLAGDLNDGWSELQKRLERILHELQFWR